MDLTYPVRQMLRGQVGINGAAVLDVLAHHGAGAGTGVEITTELLASEAGISAKTVRRTITALRDAGLVESESRFRDKQQVANRYRLNFDRIGANQLDPPGGQGDQAISTTSQRDVLVGQVVDDEQAPSNSIEASVITRKIPPGTAGEGLRPSVGETQTNRNQENAVDGGQLGAPGVCDRPGLGASGTRPAHGLPPRDSPKPLPAVAPNAGVLKKLIEIRNDAQWLVAYFEAHVVDKTNRDRTAKGRKLIKEVSEERKGRWLRNALTLVDGHPVREIADVIDWLFNTQHGYLPSWIAECSTFPSNDKVTRLQQVEEVYGLLLEAMASGPAQPG